MRFGFVQEQERLREWVRAELATTAIAAELAAVRQSTEREPDVRPLYRALGERGLLAVSWPREYGGAGLTATEAAIVAEELFLAGVPDTLHVNTIQIVGQFLLTGGTPEQRKRYLPALARGERFAGVLYTEPDAGSDLAALRTVAERDGGYLLTGVKVFSLKSDLTDLALCAARTGGENSRYEGITLFLLDMHADGVRRSDVLSITAEKFHRVELHRVAVSADDVIGEVDGGWPLLVKALAIERTGLDYLLRAVRWITAARSAINAADQGPREQAAREQAAAFAARCDAGWLLAHSMTQLIDEDRVDEVAMAAAKYYTSELAAGIARWAALHAPRTGSAGALLDAAYREGPALTISAGTSEVMLQIVASAVLEEGYAVADPEDDEVLRQLRAGLRALLHHVPGPVEPHDPPACHDRSAPAWSELLKIHAPALEVPASSGGLGFGCAAGVIVAEELGRAALGSPYPGTALALQALTLGQRQPGDGPAAALLAGSATAAAAGFGGRPLAATASPGSGGRVTGEAAAITADADWFAVPVLAAGQPVLALLSPDRVAGRSPLPDGGTLLRFDDAPLPEPGLTCPLGADSPVLACARIRQAAYLTGLALGALAECTEYVSKRRQFGRPLRDFQTVAFTIARHHAGLQPLRLLVHRAAWLADSGQPAGQQAAAALALAAQAAVDAVSDAMHLCGVRALTAQTLVQRYYRMIYAEAVRFGAPAVLWRACLPPPGRGVEEAS
ncbi:MAG TPA: acyl-CoA dehydrogenase family protein [Streptosporangiaceae bacterium]|nr:acyl-CoA dehydrogenase family protein [Streptosporangiaceae bacterium]